MASFYPAGVSFAIYDKTSNPNFIYWLGDNNQNKLVLYFLSRSNKVLFIIFASSHSSFCFIL